MNKDSFYFPHDSNARNDTKCIKLRRLKGWEGYGLFWGVIEMLREATDHRINLKAKEDICFELRITPEDLDVLFECDLLQKDAEFFFSKSLLSRMKRAKELTDLRRAAGRKGGRPKQTESKEEANEKQNVNKNNYERKGNERKGKEMTVFWIFYLKRQVGMLPIPWDRFIKVSG